MLYDCVEQNDGLEREAELLVLQQLDLLVQLEGQVRVVERMKSHLEKLRGAKYRIGPRPAREERQAALARLIDELGELDRQGLLQHQCCLDMRRAVGTMLTSLVTLGSRFPAGSSSAEPKRDSHD